MKFATLLMAATCGVIGVCADAAVRLPALFGDNMVLQRDVPVPIWGWAEPGQEVTVSVAAQRVSATADAAGRWQVTLAPLPVGGPLDVVVIAGKESVALKNVLVGDVWVCSGQSNMQMRLHGSLDWEAAAAKADYPKIRFFNQVAVAALEPQTDIVSESKTGWTVCDPKTVLGLTAAGYYFARDLHTSLDVPIGLVANALNGSTAEAWTSRAALLADPALKTSLDFWERYQQKYATTLLAETIPALQTWAKVAGEAKAGGKPLPMPPLPEQVRFPFLSVSDSVLPPPPPKKMYLPLDPRTDADVNWRLATGLYNGTILPLTPLAIKGVAWYQGEHNTDYPVQYRKLFPALITCWRQAWGRGDLPFLFVQLPNYYARTPEPGESGWAATREAQAMALALPNTGMAVTIDIGEAASIHPLNKEDVGKRLALVALGTVYGRKIEYSGPVYDGMTVEEGAIRLRFTHVGNGLAAKGGTPLQGFAICGEDRKFVWAEATPNGGTVLVRSAKVAKPVAVRYAWANNPVCNLTNDTGLPAGPFRTDTW